MKFLFSLLFILTTPLSFNAQSENNVWLFGQGAGLDFSTNPPTPITSPLVVFEGTAVLSDDNREVLFIRMVKQDGIKTIIIPFLSKFLFTFRVNLVNLT